MNELNNSMGNAQSIKEQEHIGIQNVNQRIRLFYGENCGVTISRVETGGTKVIIKLPDNT